MIQLWLLALNSTKALFNSETFLHVFYWFFWLKEMRSLQTNVWMWARWCQYEATVWCQCRISHKKTRLLWLLYYTPPSDSISDLLCHKSQSVVCKRHGLDVFTMLSVNVMNTSVGNNVVLIQLDHNEVHTRNMYTNPMNYYWRKSYSILCWIVLLVFRHVSLFNTMAP